jgi:hypothetical protein
MNLFCRIGLHDYGKNHGGIKHCKKCPKWKYFGLTGLLLQMHDKTDEELKKIAGE